jgi:hypothetical protein
LAVDVTLAAALPAILSAAGALTVTDATGRIVGSLHREDVAAILAGPPPNDVASG